MSTSTVLSYLLKMERLYEHVRVLFRNGVAVFMCVYSKWGPKKAVTALMLLHVLPRDNGAAFCLGLCACMTCCRGRIPTKPLITIP